MGEQKNLTDENVEELRAHLDKMKMGNPELTYSFYSQPRVELNPEYVVSSLDEIKDTLATLERKIDLIFDGHVLLNGVFKKL